MLKTIPRHRFTWNCEVFDNDNLIGSISFAAWGQAGELETQGSVYKVYRESLLSGNFILEQNGNCIARAQKPNPISRLFQLDFAGIQYELKAESRSSRSFILQEQKTTIGSINPEHGFTRRAIIDLPTNIPLTVRLFMVWLVMLLWRSRERSRAAAISASSSSSFV